MHMKKFLCLSALIILSSVVFATKTCPPSGTCDVTAADLSDEEPVYYPPAPPNPLNNPDGQNQPLPGQNPQIVPGTMPNPTGE